MSKAVKEIIAGELRARYAGMESAFVVDLTGLNVQEQQKLRRALREKSARLEVVKNSLARTALQESPLESLGQTLAGPCALVTSSESVIEVAKVLVEAAKEFSKLQLKQAILEGYPELLTVEAVSKMKGREELVGEVAMLVSSPGRAIAGCLQSPAANVAGCLKAMIDQAA